MTEILPAKLESLLDISLRQSVGGSDPYKVFSKCTIHLQVSVVSVLSVPS